MKKCVVSEGFTFNVYKMGLFGGTTIYKEQILFENMKHDIYTINEHKIVLNRHGNKRIV